MDMDTEPNLDETVHSLTDLLESGQDEEFMTAFSNLHEFEKGQAYAAMPEGPREVAWRVMDDETLASVFDNLELEPQQEVELLEEMPPQKGAKILQLMYADNEADLLQAMSARQVATYLSLMPRQEAAEMRRLINYEDQTAGALMATEYLAVQTGQTVDEVLKQVKQQASDAESIIYVYVVDAQHHLVGVTSLRDLLTHPDEMNIDEITNTRVVSVKAGDDQHDVAQIVADYNFFSIPVTDDDNRLLGIVTVDDIVDVIDEEAVGEYSGLAAVDVSQTDDSPWHSALKRAPWLLGLMLLGLLTAAVIGLFEKDIYRAPVLAVFLTLITGTAGNAGTQSLALAIRGLSDGSEKNRWRALLSELCASLMIAALAGLVIGLIMGLWFGSDMMGLALGLAMALAILASSLLGYFIPVCLSKFGLDPAFANGPLLTTLSDLSAVFIYFWLVQEFLTYFIGR
ncbi:magnesium transporter [Eupransor demetentiae]|uniref:Magnesium transporter MgtE n=1 Tax=Eupransor demetentiae TaxID=3109584 RepID=A0ABP0EN22_9LACO|nr:Mg/Co/Ni transporter MgtE (contains CBS domain) (MgtE) [Lactobacillaceae bacterium LMG 33000]